MLVKLHGLQPVATVPPSFEDVIADDWYAGFVEQAAKQGWMLGYGNCYGKHPCVTMPLMSELAPMPNGMPSMKTLMARERRVGPKRSPMREFAAGAQVASPTPTPSRTANSCQ